MPSRCSEAQMRGPVCDMSEFAERGVRFRTEVAFGKKRIDLAGLSDDRRLYAVELKVSDWRRAVWQASIYQLCANYAFIAINADYLHRVDQAHLEGLGIGLISVTDSVAQLVLAAQESALLQQRDHDCVRAELAATLSSAEEP